MGFISHSGQYFGAIVVGLWGRLTMLGDELVLERMSWSWVCGLYEMYEISINWSGCTL